MPISEHELRRTIKAQVRLFMEVGALIREAGEIPNGVLYGTLMVIPGYDMNQHAFVIQSLKDHGMIVEVNHMLKWIGR